MEIEVFLPTDRQTDRQTTLFATLQMRLLCFICTSKRYKWAEYEMWSGLTTFTEKLMGRLTRHTVTGMMLRAILATHTSTNLAMFSFTQNNITGLKPPALTRIISKTVHGTDRYNERTYRQSATVLEMFRETNTEFVRIGRADRMQS